ncbi:serine/threonine protein kinase [Haliangium sp.]|uniref:serine/threonine protein kinase n=1 Tax=Haliangium sp. TaxID=2663208 RepID=UPI003D137044
MSIAVGQILDKYEILEQVGHGGMAVVYRGLDRSLRRQVAIKVLHKHLADSREARERFAREAHAVAKLRHENILEIYAFGGEDAEESYIVTEFIDGPTLKQAITDHPPRYPEIGALVTTQVCRALAHAHSFGVLHRDVKPENIMIRADGVVKLTDFGIAQMLDMQRVTVTGQLLGSPAYMSPEHLDGQPLDFRTDIFAVGVLLYQLVVGELPFQGRNPHQILKRISDGTYRDPRQANPLVGNQLARIIETAMARAKEDRYADISEMWAALDRYLEGSGLTQHRQELARYFASPVSYELALRERLLSHLSRRGQEMLATDQVAALELFNRALTIDPDHREVLAQVDRLTRRRRRRRTAGLITGLAAAAGVTVAAVWWWPAPSSERADEVTRPAGVSDATSSPRPTRPTPAGPAAAVPLDAGAALAEAADADADAGLPPVKAATVATVPAPSPRSSLGRTSTPRPTTPRVAADAGVQGLRLRRFALTVSPLKSEYRVGEGPWIAIPRGRAELELGPGEHTVEVRNDACCEPARQVIGADDLGDRTLAFALGYLPATITPRCSRPGVSVQIDGGSARLDRRHTIFFTRSLGQRTVTVTFFDREATDEQRVQVQYNQAKVVTCALR